MPGEERQKGRRQLAFFGYPVARDIVMSFQDYKMQSFFTGEAPWVGFANYAAVFSDEVAVSLGSGALK